MSSKKTFVNTSNFEMYVTLYARDENAATLTNGPGAPAPFTLPAGGRVTKEYSADNLNAVNISWTNQNVRIVYEQEVLEIGSWWDNIINDNSIIYFTQMAQDYIRGGN